MSGRQDGVVVCRLGCKSRLIVLLNGLGLYRVGEGCKYEFGMCFTCYLGYLALYLLFLVLQLYFARVEF